MSTLHVLPPHRPADFRLVSALAGLLKASASSLRQMYGRAVLHLLACSDGAQQPSKQANGLKACTKQSEAAFTAAALRRMCQKAYLEDLLDSATEGQLRRHSPHVVCCQRLWEHVRISARSRKSARWASIKLVPRGVGWQADEAASAAGQGCFGWCPNSALSCKCQISNLR